MSSEWTLSIEAMLQPTAWALVHFLWQGTLVALMAAAALTVLRHSGARLRYGVALACLVVMACLPLWTAAHLAARQGTAPSPAPVMLPAASDLAGPAGAIAPATLAAPSWWSAAGLRGPLEDALPAVLTIWLAGVLVLSLTHLGGARRLRRWRRQATRAPQRWAAILDDLASRMGLERPPALLQSARFDVPAVLGWWRPVVLVPASAFAGLTPQQLEAVLAHELAHLRRRDPAVNLFQVVVETLLFYHPGVWWVSRQIRAERESCCDAAAVEVCGSPRTYALALAELEGLRAVPAPSLSAAGGSLVERLRRLAGGGAPAPLGAWRTALPAGLAAVLILAGAATLALTAEVSAEPAPSQAEEAPDEDAPDELDEMRRELRGTAYEHLAGDELERIRRHGLDGDDLREIAEAGWDALSVDELVELARHGVDGDDLREFSVAGLEALTVDGVVRLARHGIDGDDARELRQSGYDLGVEEMLQLARHGLDGDDLAEFHQAGLELDIEAMLQLARHGLDGDDVRELRDSGYELEVEEMLQLARHGLDGDDIAGFHQAGLELDVEGMLQLARHGLDGDDVRELRDSGYELEVEEMLQLARYGLDGDDLEEYVDSGYDLAIEEIVELARLGVDGDDLADLRAAGHGDLPVEEILELARRGELEAKIDGDE